MIHIIRAESADLAEITEIYNEAVLNSTATFDTEIKSESEQRAWFEHHGTQHPIFVAKEKGNASSEKNPVLGWASLSIWSERAAYSSTAEVSFYVRADSRGRGIGKLLLGHLDQEAKKLNYHSLVSRITGESQVSIHLHEVFGFEKAGVLKEVGKKFDRYLDVVLMQKLY